MLLETNTTSFHLYTFLVPIGIRKVHKKDVVFEPSFERIIKFKLFMDSLHK